MGWHHEDKQASTGNTALRMQLPHMDISKVTRHIMKRYSYFYCFKKQITKKDYHSHTVGSDVYKHGKVILPGIKMAGHQLHMCGSMCALFHTTHFIIRDVIRGKSVKSAHCAWQMNFGSFVLLTICADLLWFLYSFLHVMRHVF